jgi:hypothetical protein
MQAIAEAAHREVASIGGSDSVSSMHQGVVAMIRTGIYRPAWLGAALSVLAVGAVIGPVRAADPAPAAAAPAQDAAAQKVLIGMADFIARAPGLSLTLRSNYDAIQEDGQRIEFGERRRIVMQRPDKLRVEVERSDGERGGLTYDGRWLTAFNATENVFARTEKVADLDQMLVYIVRDLKVTFPLARMLTTGFPLYVEKRAADVTLVEESTLFDVPTDHLAIRTQDVDLQLWIAKGPEPLPRRVVITYKNAPGEPQFRADLFDWKIAPGVDSAEFSFVPPAGAEQVMLLAPQNPTAMPTTSTGDSP